MGVIEKGAILHDALLTCGLMETPQEIPSRTLNSASGLQSIVSEVRKSYQPGPSTLVRCNIHSLFSSLGYLGFIALIPYLVSLGWHFAAVTFFVTGVIQYHFIVVAHEASHRYFYTNPGMNQFFGNLFGSLVTIPLREYRSPHLVHHRQYGGKDDTDYEFYQSHISDTSVLSILWRLFVDHSFIGTVKRRVRIFMDWNKDSDVVTPAKTAGEKVMVASAQLGLLAFFAYFGEWWYYFAYWVGPMLIFPGFINTLRVLCEHGGFEEYQDTESRRLAVRTNRPAEFKFFSFLLYAFEKFLYGPFNFNYHVEHHLFPGVHYVDLPKVYQKLVEMGYYDRHPNALSPSYFETLVGIARRNKYSHS